MQFQPLVTLPAFLLASCITSAQARSEENIKPGAVVGGLHGNGFDDGYLTGSDHKRISSITLYGCGDDEHIFGLGLTYKNLDWLGPGQQQVTVTHGKVDTNDKKTLDLGPDEYITDLWFTTYHAKVHWLNHRTRIASMAVKTNKGREIKRCGADAPQDDHYHRNAGNGALLYFSGGTGDVIDNLTPWWLPIQNF